MFKIPRRDLVRGFGLLSIFTLITPFVFAGKHGSSPQPRTPNQPIAPPPPPPPAVMPRATNGYLVRGEKGEYYFLSGSELDGIAQKGNCKITECVAVSPARVIVKKQALANFRIFGSQGLWKRLKDKELLRSLDSSIRSRQALGVNVRAALSNQGFAYGIANPTKAG